MSKGLINPPRFVGCNVHYECFTGSIAYGSCTDTSKSDYDVYGFCVPPKKIIFPHLDGVIDGFGRQRKRFDQFQKHHIIEENTKGGRGQREIDLTIYNIVRYFHLCLENNPNMIDSLFVPADCVLHSTQVGQAVRENRRLFLHKGSWPKLKGYAYSQLNKIRTRDDLDRKDNKGNPVVVGKRRDLIDEYGYDVKFASHVVRLMNQAEQILLTHDLDLRRDAEQLKAIRRGEWTVEQVREFFARKEVELETIYQESTLRWGPDEEAIKALLLRCLGMCYEDIDRIVPQPNAATKALGEIQAVLDKHEHLMRGANA
jgi:hypothetical protein